MSNNNLYKIFFAIAFTMLIASLIIFFNMSKVSNKPQEIDEAWGSGMEVLGWLNGAVSDVPSLALQITLETDPKQMGKIEKEKLEPLLQEIDTRSLEYETKYMTSSEEKELYVAFRHKWQDYRKQLQEVLDAGKIHNFSLANEKYKASYPTWERANLIIGELIQLNNDGAKNFPKGFFVTSISPIIWIVFLNVISILISILISVRFAFKISSQEMKDIAQLLTQLNENHKKPESKKE